MVRMERGPPTGRMKTPVSVPAPSKYGSTLKMAANIKVVVRVRPLNEKEKDLNNRVVVDVVDERMLVFDPKEETRPFFYQGVQQSNKHYLKRANKELKFVFDHICDMNASNMDVFERTTKDMLSALMEGYNCSVFVYGATGAGKTFTMIGSLAHPGITYLTMENLFHSINSFEEEREFDISVSYIEVYNENVFDLLKPSSTPLQLREDSKYGVMVAGLTLNNINTARELLNMLENGNKNRTQHPTDANAESSRSHAVFQVYVKMRYKTSSQVRLVKLTMIDLAGSERASATGCVGDRFKEGANINKSLLALGNCINSLADGSAYIPYRDSKLTRLLKDSLGGNCKTVMIANISPSSISYEDTYNTLKYAARANKIQLSIKKNIVDGQMRLSQYIKINEELTKKVQELQAKLTLSSVKQVTREADLAKEQEVKEWRRRISLEEAAFSVVESRLLALMSRQRVLALRWRLRTRSFAHVAELAHRSSSDGIEQMCTEDIPRQERTAQNYVKQSVRLDSAVLTSWNKWNESQKKLDGICEQASSLCPELTDFIKTVRNESELRRTIATAELRSKLLAIEEEAISKFTEYTREMPSMLKKLYLTLKGHNMVPPALTAEYLEIMKKANSAAGIKWSDEDAQSDPHFKFISNLDVDKPSTFEYDFSSKENGDTTIDIATDSEDLVDIENKEPIELSAKKRKGTPIHLSNNETIVINDSFDALDTTKIMSSAKKLKRELGIPGALNPTDLNSTFVLAGKMEAFKKPMVKTEKGENVPHRAELADRTNINTVQRTINFDKSKIVKHVVGKALPFRRAGASPPRAAGFGSCQSRAAGFGTNQSRAAGFGSSQCRAAGFGTNQSRAAGFGPNQSRAAGFGSSLSRDGTPLERNIVQGSYRSKTNFTQNSVGFKAVRARSRMQNHPYSRSAPARK